MCSGQHTESDCSFVNEPKLDTDFDAEDELPPHTQVLLDEELTAGVGKFARWFFKAGESDKRHGHRGNSWWAVMCLTGVDYFSTLGYQPAIAALAAGLLSPLATLVLVALTLFGALPVYRRVATASYKGEGSIHLLEKLLPWWLGKLFVLVMLGFAATDYMITITLSAADASAHIAQNPFTAGSANYTLLMTIALIAVLGIVFLVGFKEAIGIAVGLVAAYLLLNAVVVVNSLIIVANHPGYLSNWLSALTHNNANPLTMIAIALVVFPKLALGLSGFETGVAVMPQIRGASGESKPPHTRIRGTKKLLTTAAVIMSALLILTSFITTLLIPQKEFQAGGQANGRALAYLAHQNLGPIFGSFYDVSTILILWFAGASAMAGLINLVPRYLPRYGMAPQWAGLSRPLVVAFTLIAFLITIIFNANVDQQAGAYATGVLVLITSASLSAALLSKKKGKKLSAWLFGLVTAVFVYTTVQNVIERPDGVKIASIFIAAIIFVSMSSRVKRSFELRAKTVHFDDVADSFLAQDATEIDYITLIAHETHGGGDAEYRAKSRDESTYSHIPATHRQIFIEVTVGDSSEFIEDLDVTGVVKYGYRVLEVTSSSIPNAIAAVLLAIRDEYGVVPDIYFEWSDGNPISNMLKFLVTGGGEIAVVTREVLRQAEPLAKRRPRIHAS